MLDPFFRGKNQPFGKITVLGTGARVKTAEGLAGLFVGAPRVSSNFFCTKVVCTGARVGLGTGDGLAAMRAVARTVVAVGTTTFDERDRTAAVANNPKETIAPILASARNEGVISGYLPTGQGIRHGAQKEVWPTYTTQASEAPAMTLFPLTRKCLEYLGEAHLVGYRGKLVPQRGISQTAQRPGLG